ncbi:HAD family hydrolase [Prevotella falsenii]|uniref:HAD family hydrolase n=1 Tax=Prevotella falsenii TaxID=515414 RepID=UPI0004691014|nr:HAD family hydrolase [Prevotella falsenii]
MIKGYIFDYGGTIDTAGCHWGMKIWHACEQLGFPITEEQYRKAYVYAERTLGKNPIIQPDFTFRRTLEEKIRLQSEHLQLQGLVAATGFSLANKRAKMVELLYNDVVRTVAESKEVLLKLKESYPLVLVSNFYGNIGVVLQEFGLDGIFQEIIESAVVNVRKPDPRIYQLGVETLQLPAENVVVVGDSYTKDIVPAHSIGCKTVWIKGESWTSDEPEQGVADRVITSLKELNI